MFLPKSVASSHIIRSVIICQALYSYICSISNDYRGPCIFSLNPVRPPCNCPPTRASGRRGARNNLRLAEAFRLTDEPQEVLARERENERKIGFCVHFWKIQNGIWQLFSRFVTLKIVEGLQTRNGICPFFAQNRL